MKRLGTRLIVVAVTTLTNLTKELTNISSSPLDFYRVDDLTQYESLALQLATDICARLRQLLLAH